MIEAENSLKKESKNLEVTKSETPQLIQSPKLICILCSSFKSEASPRTGRFSGKRKKGAAKVNTQTMNFTLWKADGHFAPFGKRVC